MYFEYIILKRIKTEVNMFELDKQIISFIYFKCKSLGGVLGYGALEGFITYLGIIALGIFKGIEISKEKK